MYRLTLYSLIFLVVGGVALAATHALPYNPLSLAFSAVFLLIICLTVNYLFTKIYRAPSNTESVYITALILALIITPPTNAAQCMFLVWASVFAMASKYVLAVGKKHIFNPAAFGVALTALAFNQYASWWIGTLCMLPLVAISGFLITRKIKRWDLVLSFLAVSAAMVIGHAFLAGQNSMFIAKALLIDSPLLFFSLIMLTEPATTPPTTNKRMMYGALTGVLYAPFVNIFGFYFSPELALLAGNIFSYLVSPKEKLILQLKEKISIANNTYDFIFEPKGLFKFHPGQYLEWTLAHKKRDTRGIRRYFTIASSPTENTVRIGVKFYDKPSSYKQALETLDKGEEIIASQLAGDFTLPKNPDQKLVFIAGGIGITPFRSMIKYLIDTNERRDIILFYANNSFADIAYQEVFKEAQEKLGTKTIYTLHDSNGIPAGFDHEIGFISSQMIKKKAPDYQERIFYISGPRSMIVSFQQTLKEMGVPKNHIKTDFFPGFA